MSGNTLVTHCPIRGGIETILVNYVWGHGSTVKSENFSCPHKAEYAGNGVACKIDEHDKCYVFFELIDFVQNNPNPYKTRKENKPNLSEQNGK